MNTQFVGLLNQSTTVGTHCIIEIYRKRSKIFRRIKLFTCSLHFQSLFDKQKEDHQRVISSAHSKYKITNVEKYEEFRYAICTFQGVNSPQ